MINLLEQEIKLIKPNIEFVLVSVCTCQRPKMLKQALLSIAALDIPKGIKIEVLVVDNDVNESAKSVVLEVQNELAVKINYSVEKNRGIAYARNKLLQEAVNLGASHILLFDDDELMTPTTLVEHINMYTNHPNALIISGPTPNIFEENYPVYIKKHMVFKQSTTKLTGTIRKNCAAGNVFFPVSIAKDYSLKFSNEYVFMGGEDGDFFGKASDLGYTIVWCNEAKIYEVVSPARATLNYVFKKCYYNGYAGAYAKFKSNNKISKKLLYILKTCLVLMINFLMILPSLLFGLTAFFNTIGITVRTLGKICGAIKNEPYNFYKVIYGE